MKAKKENKVYSITTEQEKQRYLKAGYDIYSDNGKLMEYSPQKKISYSQYDALLKENEALKEERLALRGENASLRSQYDALRKNAEALEAEVTALKAKKAESGKAETVQAEEKASGKKAGG